MIHQNSPLPLPTPTLILPRQGGGEMRSDLTFEISPRRKGKGQW